MSDNMDMIDDCMDLSEDSNQHRRKTTRKRRSAGARKKQAKQKNAEIDLMESLLSVPSSGLTCIPADLEVIPNIAVAQDDRRFHSQIEFQTRGIKGLVTPQIGADLVVLEATVLKPYSLALKREEYDCNAISPHDVLLHLPREASSLRKSESHAETISDRRSEEPKLLTKLCSTPEPAYEAPDVTASSLHSYSTSIPEKEMEVKSSQLSVPAPSPEALDEHSNSELQQYQSEPVPAKQNQNQKDREGTQKQKIRLAASLPGDQTPTGKLCGAESMDVAKLKYSTKLHSVEIEVRQILGIVSQMHGDLLSVASGVGQLSDTHFEASKAAQAKRDRERGMEKERDDEKVKHESLAVELANTRQELHIREQQLSEAQAKRDRASGMEKERDDERAKHEALFLELANTKQELHIREQQLSEANQQLNEHRQMIEDMRAQMLRQRVVWVKRHAASQTENATEQSSASVENDSLRLSPMAKEDRIQGADQRRESEQAQHLLKQEWGVAIRDGRKRHRGLPEARANFP